MHFNILDAAIDNSVVIFFSEKTKLFTSFVAIVCIVNEILP
jgi:hypothetical protein